MMHHLKHNRGPDVSTREWRRRRISTVVVLLAVASLTTSPSVSGDDEAPAAPDSKVTKQFMSVYAKDATEFAIFRDSAHREKLDLRQEPVYVWTNAIRGQHGAVYVWTWHGRPEAIASIFSTPAPIKGKRSILHEFHSLSTSVLVPQREGENRWEPQAGLTFKPLPDAPVPADSARQRMFQMRALSRDFTAHSIDQAERPWELRLLTRPLFRYESTDSGIIDGALFAFVTSAGTDPEVIVVLEAERAADGPIWTYAACRFSDLDLHLEYKKSEVWSSIRSEENVWEHDPQHLYRLYRDRRIDDIVPDAGEP
jgi:hypothetical protein